MRYRAWALRQYHRLGAAIALLLVLGLLPYQSASASELGSRTLTISANTPNSVATYKLAFSFVDTTTLGSYKLEFCTNLPPKGVNDAACSAPTGFDASQLQLASQSGETGFQRSNASTANVVILSRTPANRQASNVQYELGNITNPAADGTYYARIRTYASDDASGTAVDYGVNAISITNLVPIQAEVPQYLLFCSATVISTSDCGQATGFSANFGEFSASHANVVTTQFQVATNAADGYNVRIAGGTLTSGNDIITALASNAQSQPGTQQFGLNLVANQSPAVGQNPAGGSSGAPMPLYGTPNSFRFVPNEVLASAPRPDATNKYTVSYLANIAKDQASGLYVTTLTYICLANF